MNEQLDPTIINLAKAIRQHESGGNFSIKGKSGEHGAYQFMPETWNSASKKYLGRNVQLEQATPQEQNEVAYKQIKDWKSKGYNVGQIASLWNSGKPEWEGNVGVNSLGVSYDVPKYVNSVASLYQQYKNNGSYQSQTGGEQTKQDVTNTPEFISQVNRMYDQGSTPQEVQEYVRGVRNGTIQAPTEIYKNPMEGLTGAEYASGFGEEFRAGGEHIISSVQKGGENISEGMGMLQTGGIDNRLEGATKVAFGASQAALGTFMGGVQTAFSPITPIISKAFSQIAYKNPGLANSIGSAIKPMDDFAQKYPEESGVIGDAVNSLLSIIGERITPEIKSPNIKKPKLPNLKEKFGLKAKTPEEITAIAKDIDNWSPKKIAEDLSPSERQAVYESKALLAKEEATMVSENVAKKLEEDMANISKEIDTSKSDVTSEVTKEAQALKSRTQQLLQDMSSPDGPYIKAIEKGSTGAGMENKQVGGAFLNDIESNLMIKDPGVQELAQKMIKDMGLETEGGRIVRSISNKEKWEYAKSLYQSIGKSAKNGSQTFSKADFDKMETYAFLMENLGENGVNMKEANDIWRSWSKLRRDVVKKVKPWDDSTGPVTQTLETAFSPATSVKGKLRQQKALKFINSLEKAIEKSVDLPDGTLEGVIGTDVKEAISKLTEAQQNKLNIEKVSKEVTKEIKKELKDTLTNQNKPGTLAFEQVKAKLIAEKKQKINKIISNVLKTLGIISIGGGAINTVVNVVN